MPQPNERTAALLIGGDYRRDQSEERHHEGADDPMATPSYQTDITVEKIHWASPGGTLWAHSTVVDSTMKVVVCHHMRLLAHRAVLL